MGVFVRAPGVGRVGELGQNVPPSPAASRSGSGSARMATIAAATAGVGAAIGVTMLV
jgi:hypothetical protein